MRTLPLIMQVAAQPWAIERDYLPTVAAVLARATAGRDAAGGVLNAQERGAVNAPATRTGTLAVIPVTGVLVPKAGPMDDVSGLTSYEHVKAQIRAAVADADVQGILLRVDSPGGSVAGTHETGEVIRQASERKPVFAVADASAASAAYWLASPADRLFVTPSGSVGSVGVYAVHQDFTKALEKQGIGSEIVSAGKFKAERHPLAGPLTDEARAALQADIDHFYGEFVAAVAQGRGTSPAKVKANFGEGRMVLAAAAVRAGMADGVATYEQAVNALADEVNGTRRHVGPSAANTAGGGIVSDTAAAAVTRMIEAGTEATVPRELNITSERWGVHAANHQSFKQVADGARDAAAALVTRVESLADVARGRLTNSKRHTLTETVEGLNVAVAALERVLADTDNTTTDADELAALHARHLLRESVASD